MNIRTCITSFLALTAFAVSTQNLAAQNEFRFTTYGMVCNQCAYGIEQALQHTDGVDDTIVDLRNGNVVVQADAANPPNVEALVKKIIDQRISLKNIEATLVGRIVQSDSGWQLIYGAQRLALETFEGLALEEYADQTVTVEGKFEGFEGVDNAEGSPRFILRSVNRV